MIDFEMLGAGQDSSADEASRVVPVAQHEERSAEGQDIHADETLAGVPSGAATERERGASTTLPKGHNSGAPARDGIEMLGAGHGSPVDEATCRLPVAQHEERLAEGHTCCADEASSTLPSGAATERELGAIVVVPSEGQRAFAPARDGIETLGARRTVHADEARNPLPVVQHDERSAEGLCGNADEARQTLPSGTATERDRGASTTLPKGHNSGAPARDGIGMLGAGHSVSADKVIGRLPDAQHEERSAEGQCRSAGEATHDVPSGAATERELGAIVVVPSEGQGAFAPDRELSAA